jgi:ubiquinone/menaquinone biosynthesis C-methylase UbiE
MFQRGGPTFLELVKQALQSTERGYDMLAPKFDLTPFRTPDAILEPMARLLGPATPGRSVDAALDVCCGTGAAMRWLRPLCRKRVVGIDFSEGMLAEARARLAPLEQVDAATVELVKGDALAMPFASEFDIATCTGALGHVEPHDEDRFVAGIARALRPGGRFAFPTAEMPSPVSPSRWIARAFNGVMRARNAVYKPEFVMYYLTFMWPGVRPLLERHGFQVEAHTGVCERPFSRIVIVVATRSKERVEKEEGLPSSAL